MAAMGGGSGMDCREGRPPKIVSVYATMVREMTDGEAGRSEG